MKALYYGQVVNLYGMSGFLIPAKNGVALEVIPNTLINPDSFKGKFTYCGDTLVYFPTEAETKLLSYIQEGSIYVARMEQYKDLFLYKPFTLKLHVWIQRAYSLMPICEVGVLKFFTRVTSGFSWEASPEGANFWNNFVSIGRELREKEKKILRDNGISISPALTVEKIEQKKIII